MDHGRRRTHSSLSAHGGPIYTKIARPELRLQGARANREPERIGLLMAVIDRRVLLGEVDACWTSLVSESGKILVEGGKGEVERVPAGVSQITHPEVGLVRISKQTVQAPEGGVTHPWILAQATPDADRFQSVRVLGWMIGLTTLLSSVLVLGVVSLAAPTRQAAIRLQQIVTQGDLGGSKSALSDLEAQLDALLEFAKTIATD